MMVSRSPRFTKAYADIQTDAEGGVDRTIVPRAGVAPPVTISLTSVLRVVRPMSELVGLPFNARIAFLLFHIDDVSSVAHILDVCPMPKAEALTFLQILSTFGAIEVVTTQRRRERR